MSSYVETLLEQFSGKGILIDANLLLLYLVGGHDPRLIGDGKYNKLSKYTREDYGILVRLKTCFALAVTTPHVLTEVSNLTGDLPESTRMACFGTFLETFAAIQELAIPSFEAAQQPEFRFLGLTDAVLKMVCDRYLVVSDDLRMIKKLNEAGFDALNFNHLRQFRFE